MKKLLSILCLCAMLLSLVGCSMIQYPLVYGFCCGYSGKRETKFETPDDYVDKSASKTATVEFMGQQYTGEYQESIYAGSNYYPWLEYDSEECSFSVKKSGELCSIYLRNHDEAVPIEEHFSKEEYLDIATDLAMQYADVSGWKTSVQSDAYGDHAPTQYDVEFVKYIGGIKTDEEIRISMTPSGKIYSFDSYMLGEFTEENVNGKFNYEKLEEKVLARMKKLFKEDEERRGAELAYEVEFCLSKERKNKVVLRAEGDCSCPATGENHIAAVWFVIR